MGSHGSREKCSCREGYYEDWAEGMNDEVRKNKSKKGLGKVKCIMDLT